MIRLHFCEQLVFMSGVCVLGRTPFNNGMGNLIHSECARYWMDGWMDG